MKLATCEHQGARQLGAVVGDRVLLPALAGGWPSSMLALIEAGPDAWARLASQIHAFTDSACVPLTQVRLLAPLPCPRKNIMCLGLNYADHAAESSRAKGQAPELPQYSIVFTKATTSINSPEGDIPYDPTVTTQLDWEVELGVIIGIGGRHIAAAEALRHVFGYMVINDVSARDVQFRHKQYFLGKSLDGACPMGPWIVTADELPDPQSLDLRCWVNGILKQDSNTRHQIFGIAAVISTLSSIMTLEPGDIIATGTPAGVGFARNPPEFLRPGDVVECEVQGIGRLCNTVRLVRR